MVSLCQMDASSSDHESPFFTHPFGCRGTFLAAFHCYLTSLSISQSQRRNLPLLTPHVCFERSDMIHRSSSVFVASTLGKVGQNSVRPSDQFRFTGEIFIPPVGTAPIPNLKLFFFSVQFSVNGVKISSCNLPSISSI
jgi:hypothetical protein